MENDEIERAAGVALGSLLPAKSGDRYNLTFQQFMKWCEINGVQDISENVLLAYFQQRSTVLKSPSSLWSEYSMLKMTLSLNRNQDISKFTKLKMFLKRKNQGFVPKKSKIFSKEEIEKFLVEAPNQIYLMMKVVTIMGVAGACRGDELHKMKLKDVECDKENVAVVNIKESKNNMLRRFVVSNSADSQVDYLKLLRDYIKLRPRNAQDERLFYRYERGRCVNQVVGKHTIAKVPYEIARFLKLEEANMYTGHSFRRTSATLLANASGTDILDLKRHGGWKSGTVAEGYRSESITNKIQVANKILHGNGDTEDNTKAQVFCDEIQNKSSTSFNLIESVTGLVCETKKENNPVVALSNCTNFTITINVNK